MSAKLWDMFQNSVRSGLFVEVNEEDDKGFGLVTFNQTTVKRVFT